MKTFILLLSTLSFLHAAERPNVVLIYGDDVGYGDVSIYNPEGKIPTPNIDKLASDGLLFTDGHCSAATCTPSRFSLLTGVHGFRENVNILPPDAPLCIHPDTFTLPDLFKKAGYTTAVIGKWHLGLGLRESKVDWNSDVKPGPLELGFDYSFLLPSTNDRVPCVYLENYRVRNLDPKDPLFVGKKKPSVPCTEYPDGVKDRSAMTYYQSSHGHNNSVINGIGRIGYQWGGKSALWNDETMTDEFVSQAKKFIKNHAVPTNDREEVQAPPAPQSSTQQLTNKPITANRMATPFFLYYAAQDIHVPRAPHPRFQGKTALGYRGDAMVQFDWAVGEILQALKENGLEENTIVIFSSDNGPVYDDGYKDGTTVHTSSKESDRGHDGSGPYRGGKYQIYEGGTRVPFIIKWPKKIQPGRSSALVNQIDLFASFANLLDLTLKPEDAKDSRNMLDSFLGKTSSGLPFMIEEASSRTALREGKWKLIPHEQHAELFDTEADPGEQNNLSELHPQRVKVMQETLEAIHRSKQGLRHMH